MQKPPDLTPLTAENISTYLKDNSNFSFEAQVAKILRDYGFNVSHAGTYIDGVTKKIRQFDIRAEIDLPLFKVGHLAVEQAIICRLCTSRPMDT